MNLNLKLVLLVMCAAIFPARAAQLEGMVNLNGSLDLSCDSRPICSLSIGLFEKG